MSIEDNPDWLKEHLQRISVFKPYKLDDDLFAEMEPGNVESVEKHNSGMVRTDRRS